MPSSIFDRLGHLIAEQPSVEEGVIALIDSLVSQLRAVSGPAQLTAVADDLEAHKAQLAAAMHVNTPQYTNPHIPPPRPGFEPMTREELIAAEAEPPPAAIAPAMDDVAMAPASEDGNSQGESQSPPAAADPPAPDAA